MKIITTDLLINEWDDTVAALCPCLSTFHLYSAIGGKSICYLESYLRIRDTDSRHFQRSGSLILSESLRSSA
jgi:hypothetical protein